MESFNFSAVFVVAVFLNNYYIFISRISIWSSNPVANEQLNIFSDSYSYLSISKMFILLKSFKILSLFFFKRANDLIYMIL